MVVSLYDTGKHQNYISCTVLKRIPSALRFKLEAVRRIRSPPHWFSATGSYQLEWSDCSTFSGFWVPSASLEFIWCMNFDCDFPSALSASAELLLMFLKLTAAPRASVQTCVSPHSSRCVQFVQCDHALMLTVLWCAVWSANRQLLSLSSKRWLHIMTAIE